MDNCMNVSLYETNVGAKDVVRNFYLGVRWLLILCMIPIAIFVLNMLWKHGLYSTGVLVLLILISFVFCLIASIVSLKNDFRRISRNLTRYRFKNAMRELMVNNQDIRLRSDYNVWNANRFIWNTYNFETYYDYLSFLNSYETRHDPNANNLKGCWDKLMIKRHILN